MILLSLAAAMMPVAASAHEVTVAHATGEVRASYTPRITSRIRTVGAAAGARPTGQRCVWEAEVEVHRSVDAGPAKPLGRGETLSGSRHGDCMVNRVAVREDIERRVGNMRAYIEQVAAADRATLVAELDAAQRLALN